MFKDHFSKFDTYSTGSYFEIINLIKMTWEHDGLDNGIYINQFTETNV